MGLSFLSLLYLQVSYIEEMVKMRREQFDESVRRSLDQACRNIELVETKKYLEDDVVATERAAQLYRQQAAKEGKRKTNWSHIHSIMLYLRTGWTGIPLSNSR